MVVYFHKVPGVWSASLSAGHETRDIRVHVRGRLSAVRQEEARAQDASFYTRSSYNHVTSTRNVKSGETRIEGHFAK
jgi:hypothetical protein